MKIKSIKAREILASGGFPSVEARVELESGVIGVASVPYGASAGTHEAAVILDEDPSRYEGKGMLGSVKTINEKIAPVLAGMETENQRALDEKMIELDGTENKTNFGGNTILAVSLASANAASNEKRIPLYKHIREAFEIKSEISLPNPMVVSIEGGKHADNSTDFQEFCISAVRDESRTENIRKVLESYHQLKKILKDNGYSTNVGNEGAFAPAGIDSNEKPLEFLVQAIEKAGYKPGDELAISIDPATSEVYKDGKYILALDKKELTSLEMIDYFENWFKKYPFVTAEDLLSEDDWDNWPIMTAMAKKYNVEHVGDDLTVTNIKRLQKAIDLNAISSILIKLNQIGSLTETVDCCLLAKQHGMSTVPSHRGGGETNDTAMVDLAAAVGSRFIKVGPTRGERVAKYNRLMEIEQELNS